MLVFRSFSFDRAGYVDQKIEPLWDALGSVLVMVSRKYSDVEKLFRSPSEKRRLWLLYPGPLILGGIFWTSLTVFELIDLWMFGGAALTHGALVTVFVGRRLEKLVDETVVRSPEEAEERCSEDALRALPWIGYYQHKRLICQGSVWRQVVTDLSARCGAFVVDLRGMTDDNRGLFFELGLVLSRSEAAGCLLLVDRQFPPESVREIVAQASGPLERAMNRPIIIYTVKKNVTSTDAKRIVAWLYRDAVLSGQLQQTAVLGAQS